MIGLQLVGIGIILWCIFYAIDKFHDLMIKFYNAYLHKSYNYEPDPYDFKNKAFYKLRKKWDK